MFTSKTFDLLDKIESIPKGAGSRAAKQEILENHKEDLFEFFDIAFNPYRVFGISKLPKPEENMVAAITNLNTLPAILKKIETKKGQQKGEVKQLIANIIAAYPENARKWLTQAVLKKVRVGVEAKTLVKCGYEIPIFDCLLASVNKENSLEGTVYPAFAQAKMDGVRCVRMPDGNFFGRNGKVVPNVQIQKHILTSTTYVLDGEFYSFSRKFNSIVGLFSKDDAVLPDDIVYVVFNVIPLEDWHNKKSTLTYNEQLKIIDEICKNGVGLKSVRELTKLVKNEEEAKQAFYDYMEQGFEGAMVRNFRSKYSWKRVKVKDGILTKLKPFDFDDGKIVGTYEGEGRNEGRLGGFKVEHHAFGDKTKELVISKCGGGFSDEMREEYWKDRDKYIDQWLMVKVTEFTEDGKYRFPQFESFRDAKD